MKRHLERRDPLTQGSDHPKPQTGLLFIRNAYLKKNSTVLVLEWYQILHLRQVTHLGDGGATMIIIDHQG